MRRPFVRLVFAFAAGALGGAVLPVGPAWAALSCIAVSGLSLFLCASAPSLAAVFPALAAGLLASSLRLRSFSPRDVAVAVAAGEEKLMRLRALVASSPLLGEGRLILRVRELDAGKGWRRAKGRMSARTLLPVPVGTEVQFVAVVGRSSDRDVLARSVFARAAGRPEFKRTGRRWGPKALFWELRRSLVESLHDALPPGRAALLSALLFGYRGSLTPDEWRRYSESGTGHLLSVSGLHVALVAGMGWLLVWTLGVRRKRAALVVGSLAVLYTFLTGARVPTIRACVMVLCLVSSEIMDRPRDALNVIAFAAFAILCWRPTELFSAGFQLSFCSVASITLLYPRFRDAWRRWRRFPEELLEEPTALDRLKWGARTATFLSLAAWLGAAPLVAYHFGIVSLYAVPANVVVVFLVWVTMLFGVFSVVAALFLPAAAWILSLPAAILSAAVSAVAVLPFSHVDIPRLSFLWVVAFYGLVVLYTRGVLGGVRTVACALLLGAAFVLAEALPRRSRTMQVHCARYGYAKLVLCPPRTSILVNCDDARAARTLLRRAGLSRLDALILCGDDERTRGASEFVSRSPPSMVFLPSGARPSPSLRELETSLRRLGVNYAYPARGDVLRAGEALVRFTDPPRTCPWPHGARGLSFAVEWRGAKASFGRAEGPASFIDCLWNERPRGRMSRGVRGVIFFSAGRAGALSPAFSSLRAEAGKAGSVLRPCGKGERIVFDPSGRILLRAAQTGPRIARNRDMEEKRCR